MSSRWAVMVGAWVLVAVTVFTSTAGRDGAASGERSLLAAGDAVWRRHDCQTCHSLYGLGGHLGMDLTNVSRDRDAVFIRTTLAGGRGRMPAFDLEEAEFEALLAYFDALDRSGESPLRGRDAPVFGRSR